MKLKYYLRGLGTGIIITTLVLTIAFRQEEKKKIKYDKEPITTEEPAEEEKSSVNIDFDAIRGEDSNKDSDKEGNKDETSKDSEQAQTDQEETKEDQKEDSADKKSEEGKKEDKDNGSDDASDDAKVDSSTISSEDRDATLENWKNEIGHENQEGQASASNPAGNSHDSSLSGGANSNQSNAANEPNKLGSEADNASNQQSNTSSNHISPSDSNDRTIVSVTIPEGMSSHALASYLKSVGLIQDDRKFDSYLIRQGLARVIRTGTFEVPTSANYDTLAEMLTYTDQRER